MANLKNTIIDSRLKLPAGSEAQRPSSPLSGQLRFNTDYSTIEIYTGSEWLLIGIDRGDIQQYPVLDTSTFAGTSGNTYWIQPPGASSPFQAVYSGGNYRDTDYGYWLWWQNAYRSSPSVNFYNQNLEFNVLLVEQEDSDNYQNIGYNSRRTFNFTTNDKIQGDFGTRSSGYYVMFGDRGGHGIYNTGQNRCSWSNSSGAIGAGYDGGTCGSFPNDLVMGTGTSGPTYDNRNGTWNFWFTWL